MNNKSKIAEAVLRAISKGDAPVDFPIKAGEIMNMIPKAAQYVFNDTYKENVRRFGDDYIDTRWLSDFDDVEVQYDEAKRLFFATIPALYMNLPNHKGIYHISTQKDQKCKFKEVPSNFLSLYDGLEASTLSGYIGYWPENGNRVYFTPSINLYAANGMKLLFKLFCILDFQEAYDDIFIPADFEFQVIDTLKKYYLGELILNKDYVADNRPIIQLPEKSE